MRRRICSCPIRGETVWDFIHRAVGKSTQYMRRMLIKHSATGERTIGKKTTWPRHRQQLLNSAQQSQLSSLSNTNWPKQTWRTQYAPRMHIHNRNRNAFATTDTTVWGGRTGRPPGSSSVAVWCWELINEMWGVSVWRLLSGRLFEGPTAFMCVSVCVYTCVWARGKRGREIE